ncbi:MAG TPA: hypothetical protein VLE47_02070 [Candidatus Saccharimonadales bacterium]|nr:hypothetical protein [Candidatus Saccharimonadales bacterium]
MFLLFAILAGFFPRIGILILWLFTDLVSRSFNTFIFPLLGLLFLPMTTLMYILVVGPAGPVHSFWGWLLVLIGLLLDMRSYADVAENKDKMMPQSSAPKSTPTPPAAT